MDFASTKVKLNNIKTYDSKTNNTTSVFKKKFYSDTSINSFDTYEDIDYNSIDLEEGISKSEGAKEWYEEGLNIANTIKDYGVTSGLSLVCGALELVENVGDALIMAGGAISSGIVSIWDKEKSEEIKSNTENVVKYDWTEKLYDESVKALNVDDEIAHGITHTIGSTIGTTAAYIAISCVPGGAAVTASVGAITAFGSASEMALNSGADFDEALVCGTVAGIAGAASGGVLDKVQGLSAGSKTVGQLLKNTALGAVASASEPIVNTTAQYLAYGKDLVDENGNKVYDGYFDYYNKSGGLLQTGIASVVGGVSTGIQGVKGYKNNQKQYNNSKTIVSEFTDDKVGALFDIGTAESQVMDNSTFRTSSQNSKLESDQLYRQNLEKYNYIPGYDDYYVRQELRRNKRNLYMASDILNEWGLKRGEKNYAEKALRQYAETGSVYQNNGFPYITNTNGVRSYIESLDPKIVAEYLENRPITSGSLENLNAFFRNSSSAYSDTYGVNQGGIKNLCNYSSNGQNYTYEQVREIVNDAKNNGMPIPRFKKQAFKEYFDLKNQLISKGLTNDQASIILSSIDDIGACSYAAKANSIFYKFSSTPKLFEEKFGFPMYKINSHGETVLNSNELLLDMYLFFNDTSNGGNLFTKNIYDNSYNFYTNNNIDVFGRQMLDTENQVFLSYSSGSNNDVLKNYMNSKGLAWDSYNLIKNSPNNILSDNEFFGYISAVNESIKEGKAIQLNIFSNGTEIRMLNYNSNLNTTTKKWGEGNGHAVFVTGVDNNGFVVSSWGREYLIPFQDLKNGGDFNIMLDDISEII